MRIIVAGGGTGGHITPNIALLEELEKHVSDLEVLYIGSKNGPEKDLISQKGWPFAAISCGKLRRYFSWQNFSDFFKTIWGVFQSIGKIWRFKPDVIFCKGGYVSLPVAIAGEILRIPVVIHESDLGMGLANRIAAYFASVVCVSFPETVNPTDKRYVLTGNPVRSEILQGDTESGYSFCGFSPNKKVILVMGGSKGSVLINDMISRFLPDLLKEYQVVHICGEQNISEGKDLNGYFSVGYLKDELRDVYAITDLVIARAGANSLAEFEALGLSAILIPLVQGSRGDQIKNAESFVKNNSGVILDEEAIKEDSFDLTTVVDKISRTASSTSINGRNSAASKIVDILTGFSENNGRKI